MPSPPPRFRPSLPPSKMGLVSRAKKSFPTLAAPPQERVHSDIHNTPLQVALSFSLGQSQVGGGTWAASKATRRVGENRAQWEGREEREGGEMGWASWVGKSRCGSCGWCGSVRGRSRSYAFLARLCRERCRWGSLMTARARCAIETRLCPRCWHASILAAAAAASMYYCAPMRLKKRNSASSPFSRPPP